MRIGKENRKATLEEFIKKAQLVHGDKYDYSLVEYNNTITKIKINCEKHGVFEQTPNKHLCGRTCPKCNGMNKTTNEFIDQAKLVHGDKYDYSLVNYLKAHELVKIVCVKHGIFKQTPSKHLLKLGCPKCANKNVTTEEFIEKAKLVHGDKYDYSLVEYVGSKKKVKIICSIHGVFEQMPNNHLSGSNCLKCNNKNVTTEEFIEKAKLVHGDKYDYTLTNYVNSKLKVKIICPTHGVFTQIPNGHLVGSGCLKCDNKNVTTEEFIEKAKLVHGNKFDYTNVVYVKSMSTICIICPIHGEFKQKPSDHLSGYGCPRCNESKGEKSITNYLKINGFDYIKQKKFNNCRNVMKLPFDFYLPDYNLLIEYDGEQHFKPTEYWGGETAFKKQLFNDNIKNEYAKNNNINLLRIRFDEYKNINEILDKNIKTWQRQQM